MKLGIEHNPALRIIVQEYWMPNDEYNPVYPLDTKKKFDHNATDITKLRDATMRYAKDIEDYVQGIYQRLGLPVPNAFKALKDMSDEDKAKLQQAAAGNRLGYRHSSSPHWSDETRRRQIARLSLLLTAHRLSRRYAASA